MPRGGFETTPLVVDGTLYLTTGFNRVIALDPETGRERWTYDPFVELQGDYGDGLINRGVATWLDPAAPRRSSRAAGDYSRRRSTRGSSRSTRRRDRRARTSDPGDKSTCATCPLSGRLVSHDLAAGRDRRARHRRLRHQRQRAPTCPPGVVRAFDARTGALRWSWDPLPPDVAAQSGSWRTGAATRGP